MGCNHHIWKTSTPRGGETLNLKDLVQKFKSISIRDLNKKAFLCSLSFVCLFFFTLCSISIIICKIEHVCENTQLQIKTDRGSLVLIKADNIFSEKPDGNCSVTSCYSGCIKSTYMKGRGRGRAIAPLQLVFSP